VTGAGVMVHKWLKRVVRRVVHPAAERVVLVLEGIGDDKVLVNSSSLDHPLVILPDQSIEIVGIGMKVMVGRTMRSANQTSDGMVKTSYGPATKQRRFSSVTALRCLKRRF
jgi:hypothetical protein